MAGGQDFTKYPEGRSDTAREALSAGSGDSMARLVDGRVATVSGVQPAVPPSSSFGRFLEERADADVAMLRATYGLMAGRAL